MYNLFKWYCTDTSTNQWGMKLTDKIFNFKQEICDEIVEREINLNKYTNSEIEEFINSFGYTLEETNKKYKNIEEEYGVDSNWIIAECIFELSLN